MEKKGFLLLVGLFVLVAAACATTSSTPSLTASDSPKDDQSASAAVSGTPDNLNQALIGEWRGRVKEGGWFSGSIGTLILHEIDISNAKARCTSSIGGMENIPARADFIPGPSPKLKWVESMQGQWEVVLKNNVLEGTLTQSGAPASPTGLASSNVRTDRIVASITMEKNLRK